MTRQGVRKAAKLVENYVEESDFESDNLEESAPPVSKRARIDAPVPRKPRLDNSLFDILSDSDIPLDEACSGASQMLEFDTNQGIVEVLNLVVKAAGGGTSVQLTHAATAAADLEAATKLYAPSQYPLLKNREFSRRYTEFFSGLVTELASGEVLGAQEALFTHLGALTRLSLRSIRHAAAAAVSAFAQSLSKVTSDLELRASKPRHGQELTSQLIKAQEIRSWAERIIKERSRDVFWPIRECSARALTELAPDELKALLNDETAAVRLAALRKEPSAGNWDRVWQIAEQDVDTRCRRQALKLLQKGPEELQKRALSLLADADPTVRLAAATLAIECLTPGDSSDLLISLADLNLLPVSAEALARASSECRIASCLEFVVRDRNEPLSPEVLSALINLAQGFGTFEWQDIERKGQEERLQRRGRFTSELLELLTKLFTRVEHDADLMTAAVRLSQLIDLPTVVRRGLEIAFDAIFGRIAQALQTHPSAGMVLAAAPLFAKAVNEESLVEESTRAHLHELFDAVHDRADAAHVVAGLAPYIDVSSVATPSFWRRTDAGSIALALQLGIRYPNLAKKAADYLHKLAATEELIILHTHAALKDYSVGDMPDVDTNAVSAAVLASGRAAGIVNI